MRKLVLGIALVVVLDLAFIWMMQFEAGVPEMAQVIVPSRAEKVVRQRPTLEPVQVEESVKSDDPDPVVPARDASTSGKYFSRPAASKVRKSGKMDIETASIDTERQLRDTVIFVGRLHSAEVPEIYDPSAKIVSAKDSAVPEAKITTPLPEPQKRSFESKAFGVIKKPFNVIKKPFVWIGSVVKKVAN